MNVYMFTVHNYVHIYTYFTVYMNVWKKMIWIEMYRRGDLMRWWLAQLRETKSSRGLWILTGKFTHTYTYTYTHIYIIHAHIDVSSGVMGRARVISWNCFPFDCEAFNELRLDMEDDAVRGWLNRTNPPLSSKCRRCNRSAKTRLSMVVSLSFLCYFVSFFMSVGIPLERFYLHCYFPIDMYHSFALLLMLRNTLTFSLFHSSHWK